MPRPTKPLHPPGGQPGNQNARKTGWFSKTNPPTDDQFRAAIREALATRSPATLRKIARAITFHHTDSYHRHQAAAVRQMAKDLELDQSIMWAKREIEGGTGHAAR